MIDDEALKSIEKLHELKAGGIISDDEFAAAKARILQGRAAPSTTYDSAALKAEARDWLEQLKLRLRNLKPKHWAMIAGAAVVLLIIFNSGGDSDVHPARWTCENIKDEVIAMSQGEDLEILEIGDVLSDNLGYNSIECMASAEWNRGSGRIEYGAHVSGEGNIMLEYRQN